MSNLRFLKLTIAFFCLTGLFFSLPGCSIIPQSEPLSILVLRAPLPSLPLCGEAMPEQLVVSMPDAGNGLGSERIALLFDRREVKYLAGARWDDTAPAMLQRQLVLYLEAAGCFRGVETESAGLISRYRLQTELRGLYLAYEGENAAPTAEINLRLSVLDVEHGQALGGKTVRFAEKAAGNERNQMMDALDNVVHRAMLDSARWAAQLIREERAGRK